MSVWAATGETDQGSQSLKSREQRKLPVHREVRECGEKIAGYPDLTKNGYWEEVDKRFLPRLPRGSLSKTLAGYSSDPTGKDAKAIAKGMSVKQIEATNTRPTRQAEVLPERGGQADTKKSGAT